MKRSLFPVLLLALALPVLTGCPQDSVEGGVPDVAPDRPVPIGILGTGPLVLEGTIYTIVQARSGRPGYEKYSGSGKVEVYTYQDKSLGAADLNAGEFSITINEPAALEQLNLSSYFSGWKNPRIAPADVEGVSIHLAENNERAISREEIFNYHGNENNYTCRQEYVWYFYVDRDVTIWLNREEDAGEHKEEGITYSNSWTFEAAVLQFKKGWNAVHFKLEQSVSSTRQSETTSVSLGHPDLKWIIYQ
ncbi:MAG: hypothetical protein LBH51_02075 [Treponema sp.]|jgi:hypothetical protein|nr:hypothetical protein [Treponema sp.]